MEGVARRSPGSWMPGSADPSPPSVTDLKLSPGGSGTKPDFICRQLAPHIREKHSRCNKPGATPDYSRATDLELLHIRETLRTGTGNVCVAMKTEEFERKRSSLPTMPHTLRVDVQFLG